VRWGRSRRRRPSRNAVAHNAPSARLLRCRL
jgi:hypothetical protein